MQRDREACRRGRASRGEAGKRSEADGEFDTRRARRTRLVPRGEFYDVAHISTSLKKSLLRRSFLYLGGSISISREGSLSRGEGEVGWVGRRHQGGQAVGDEGVDAAVELVARDVEPLDDLERDRAVRLAQQRHH